MSALPWDAPACTCAKVCDEADGCCSCCGGAGQDAGCQGMCWDCRGTGHPHALDDPECPDHRLTDPAPASTPDARTVYCAECGGPSDVESESTEHEDYLGQHVRTLWVRRLDCGHDEVTER